ncbi:septum formation initiator family protein [Solibacillus sp. A46]|uniref:Septum formation initiator family protein n=1 Tax=Solibacillus faecavium TaxID=2762221 RepID=A0ABR8Y3C1_9BACL|nr:septum formation initiator family protein [Solibacillus faecavium]MBD8038652.1 septum formation initiator family protein [Solibacillus faecavium]
MGRRNVQEELHNQNVQPLNNDYVRSNPQARAQIKAKIAVRRRRRIAVFFILATVAIVLLVKANMVQHERLAAKEEAKVAATALLDEALHKQELLNLQIAKLEDDEYIAKLARKEFFLSDEGEIIFTIPNKSEKAKDEEDDD